MEISVANSFWLLGNALINYKKFFFRLYFVDNLRCFFRKGKREILVLFAQECYNNRFDVDQCIDLYFNIVLSSFEFQPVTKSKRDQEILSILKSIPLSYSIINNLRNKYFANKFDSAKNFLRTTANEINCDKQKILNDLVKVKSEMKEMELRCHELQLQNQELEYFREENLHLRQLVDTRRETILFFKEKEEENRKILDDQLLQIESKEIELKDISKRVDRLKTDLSSSNKLNLNLQKDKEDLLKTQKEIKTSMQKSRNEYVSYDKKVGITGDLGAAFSLVNINNEAYQFLDSKILTKTDFDKIKRSLIYRGKDCLSFFVGKTLIGVINHLLFYYKQEDDEIKFRHFNKFVNSDAVREALIRVNKVYKSSSSNISVIDNSLVNQASSSSVNKKPVNEKMRKFDGTICRNRGCGLLGSCHCIDVGHRIPYD